MGYACDFPECVLDLAAVALLEHENRYTRLSELVGRGNERVGIFLHGIADEDQGAYFEQLGFLLGVDEDLLDLGMTGLAHDLRHDLGELLGPGDPAGGAAFAQAAVIDQLHVETAGGGDLTKHFGLEFAGGVPGWLPASGGIEGEDEAAASGWCCRFDCGELVQEFVDLRECRRDLAAVCDGPILSIRHWVPPLFDC